MKIYELVNHTEKMPHVYLDMDGVQCAFDSAVEKRIGMPRREARQKHEDEIEQLAHGSPEEVYKFFATLDQLPGGKKITDWLQQNRIPYTILSAPLRGPYSQASIDGKLEWLNNHTPGAVRGAIFTQDKHVYAVTGGKPNVLIDDYGVKIKAWMAAGGIAIKHEDEIETPDAAERTINQLEKIYGRGKHG